MRWETEAALWLFGSVPVMCGWAWLADRAERRRRERAS